MYYLSMGGGMSKIKVIVSWLIVAWFGYVFLGSLPYKFTGAPDTIYIFTTIGSWLGEILGDGIGELFSSYGAYIVGSFELVTSLVLLSPIIFMRHRQTLHFFGGLMSAAVMSGAVFFHLFSPLGWVVLHNGKPDGGSLAYSALSIVILGLVLATINKK